MTLYCEREPLHNPSAANIYSLQNCQFNINTALRPIQRAEQKLSACIIRKWVRILKPMKTTPRTTSLWKGFETSIWVLEIFKFNRILHVLCSLMVVCRLCIILCCYSDWNSLLHMIMASCIVLLHVSNCHDYSSFSKKVCLFLNHQTLLLWTHSLNETVFCVYTSFQRALPVRPCIMLLTN